MAHVDPEEARRRIATVKHWYHQIEVAPGVVTPGTNESQHALRMLPLPAECDGMRVLDVGARDGFFSFELERRGADVLAVDIMPAHETGFPVAADLLGSRVEHLLENVNNISPERHGTFDLVLFLGILYHLRNPLYTLDRMWDVCRGRILVETEVFPSSTSRLPWRLLRHRAGDEPLMRFYPRSELRQDLSNWWVPNVACARALLYAAGFDVDYESVSGTRAILRAAKVHDHERLVLRKLDTGTFAEIM